MPNDTDHSLPSSVIQSASAPQLTELPSPRDFFSAPIASHVSQRNLSVLAEQNIYLLDVSIMVGTGKRSLPFEVMGITKEQAKARKISPPTITIFEGLQKQGNRLASVVGKMRRRLLVWKPFKYFHGHDAAYMQSCLQELAEKHQEGLEYIEEHYEANFESFKIRLRDSLISYVERYGAVINRSIDSIVSEYELCFPQLDRVKEDFYYVVTGPIYLPSIAEQAQFDAAVAQAKVSLEEAEFIREMQASYKERVQQGLNQAVEIAQAEVRSRLGQVLQQIRELRPGQSPLAVRSEIDEILERCNTVLQFDQAVSLREMAEQANAVNVYLLNPESNTLQSELQELERLLHGVKQNTATAMEEDSGAQFMLL